MSWRLSGNIGWLKPGSLRLILCTAPCFSSSNLGLRSMDGMESVLLERGLKESWEGSYVSSEGSDDLLLVGILGSFFSAQHLIYWSQVNFLFLCCVKDELLSFIATSVLKHQFISEGS